MATNVANLILPQPLPATGPLLPNTSTPATNSPLGLFQTALAIANGQLAATSGRDVALQVAGEADALVEDVPTIDDEATALALALPGVAPLLIPVPVAPDAAITATPGTAAAGVAEAASVANRLPAVPAETTDTRSRVEQLRFEQPAVPVRTTQPLPQQVANLPQLANPAVEQVATPAPATVLPALPRDTTVGGPATANAAAKGSVVPAQVPLVAGLLPNSPAASQLAPTTELPAPIATSSTAGLPGTQVGDRPVMAGERFAAIAAAGARLLSAGESPAVFTRVLGQEIPVGVREAARDRFTERAADVGGATSPLPQPPIPPATAPPAAASVGRTPAVQVADEIVTHARVLERDGSVEFRLQLDPPELGRVRVHLISAGDEVRGQVLVADDAVRRMIESQLPELRQRLEAAGVNVQRFDITADTGGGNHNLYRDDAVPAAYQDPLPPTIPTPRPPPNRSTVGRVDVTV